MNVLIAPDSFKESLSSNDVSNVIEKGLKEILPTINIVKFPMSDGGEGLVESLVQSLGGEVIYQRATGPFY